MPRQAGGAEEMSRRLTGRGHGQPLLRDGVPHAMAGRSTALTRRATLAALGLSPLAVPALARAQAPNDPQPPLPWPQDRPIRLILNGAAGSGADAVTRVLAQRLQEEFRQNVVVENLPAGAGVV